MPTYEQILERAKDVFGHDVNWGLDYSLSSDNQTGLQQALESLGIKKGSEGRLPDADADKINRWSMIAASTFSSENNQPRIVINDLTKAVGTVFSLSKEQTDSLTKELSNGRILRPNGTVKVDGKDSEAITNAAKVSGAVDTIYAFLLKNNKIDPKVHGDIAHVKAGFFMAGVQGWDDEGEAKLAYGYDVKSVTNGKGILTPTNDARAVAMALTILAASPPAPQPVAATATSSPQTQGLSWSQILLGPTMFGFLVKGTPAATPTAAGTTPALPTTVGGIIGSTIGGIQPAASSTAGGSAAAGTTTAPPATPPVTGSTTPPPAGSGGASIKPPAAGGGTSTGAVRSTVSRDDIVMDIQALMQLNDVADSSMWVDGIYGPRTNASISTYFNQYKTLHDLSDDLTSGYVPNVNGEFKGPANAAWLAKLHSALVDEGLNADLDYQKKILDNSLLIIKKEIDKNSATDNATKHDYEDIRAVYVMLNLLNKNKDFPVPDHAKDGNETPKARKILEDNLGKALDQLKEKLENNKKSLDAKKTAAPTVTSAPAGTTTAAAPAPTVPPAAPAPPPAPAGKTAAEIEAEKRDGILANERAKSLHAMHDRLVGLRGGENSSNHYEKEKDRDKHKNAEDQRANEAAWNGTKFQNIGEFSADAQRKMGRLEIGADGTLWRLSEDNTKHMVAQDFTDERNKVSGLHYMMFTDHVNGQGGIMYALAAADANRRGVAFNGSDGIVKDVGETHLLNSHYQIHIADTNCDGIITPDEVHLVTPEYRKWLEETYPTRGDILSRAYAQTPDAFREKNISLDQATDKRMIEETLRLKPEDADPSKLAARFMDHAMGTKANGSGSSATAPAQTDDKGSSGGQTLAPPATPPIRPSAAPLKL